MSDPKVEFHRQARQAIDATWRAAWQNVYDTVWIVVEEGRKAKNDDAQIIENILTRLACLAFSTQRD